MGWVWKNDPESPVNGFGRVENPNPRSDGDSRLATRTVVRSHCRTEEVEPGKFLRKCERTEEILRDSIEGRPAEVLQSNKEYTEEDVTDQVLGGSFPAGSSLRGPFDFPGLRSDMEAIEKSFNFPGLRGYIDAIERSFFGGLGRFFEAAEEMRNGFFGAFGGPGVFDRDSSSNSRGVPIESEPRDGAFGKRNKPESGHVDLSGLARDV